VKDVGHDHVGRQDVVLVEGVNDALFGLAEGAGARNATQHEEAQVARVNGRRAINNITGFIAIIESHAYEVDVFSEGLSGALSNNKVVH
jgi:hypothetical protein